MIEAKDEANRVRNIYMKCESGSQPKKRHLPRR
jgi:hypothetical protein